VVPYEDGWAVRREGNEQIISKHIKQITAIRKAKGLVEKNKANFIIHRQDGTIRDHVDFDYINLEVIPVWRLDEIVIVK
jgi:hypothetical protein